MKRFTAVVLLLTAACATSSAPTASAGTVQSWGTLREALRDGQTGARVDVSSVLGPGMVGVGALADLDGEVTIVDGRLLVSRVRDGRVESTSSGEVQATILAASYVSEWQAVMVNQDVAPSELDRFVAAQAEMAGLDTGEPFPFVIKGELQDLRVHVLAGECPIRARMLGAEMKSKPYESHFARIDGLVVGIYARDSGGELTHHGDDTHVHAIVSSEVEFTGHVETVGVAAGAVLRLPATR